MLIFGNGPSLTNIISYILKNDMRSNFILLCFNDFAINNSFYELRPSSYLLLDPAYFTFNIQENTFQQIEINNKLISAFNSCNWEMSLFIPFHQRKCELEESIKNKYVKIIYFSTVHYPLFFNSNFFYSINFSNPPFQNILNAAIFLALNNKYKTIYLCGADFNLHEDLFVDNNNNLFKINKHFYDNKNESTMIIKSGNVIEKFTMSEYFRALSLMFHSFEIIKSYSVYLNVSVINLSNPSFIDSFERGTFENLKF